jgi:broad specificity phosphatase PhoE
MITSPSGRAVATAEAIAAAADDLTIERDPRWMEIDFGRVEGRTFAELTSIAPEIAAAIMAGHTDIDWPDGERAASLAARVAEAWDELILEHRPTVVVTHAGPILRAMALSRQGQATAADLLAPASFVRLSFPVKPVSRHPVLRSRA